MWSGSIVVTTLYSICLSKLHSTLCTPVFSITYVHEYVHVQCICLCYERAREGGRESFRTDRYYIALAIVVFTVHNFLTKQNSPVLTKITYTVTNTHEYAH